MLDITISREELLKGISKTQSIAEKRSSMPILSNVLLETSESNLSITATDLEISFKGSYEAEVADEGRITVPARKLFEIVHELNDETIRFQELANLNLSLKGARSNYQLHGLAPEDFPLMPDYDDVTFLDINSELLKNMIEKTLYSVSTEETRYNLSGVYVEQAAEISSNTLRFVSTDGHRLSLMDSTIEGLENLNLEKGVIISRKGLMEIRKALDDEGDIKLGFTSNSAVVIKDEAVLVIRLLEGRFPEYNLVIPKNNEQVMKIGRNDFMDMLRRISVMSSDKYKGTKFTIEPKNLSLASVNPDLGEAREDLPIEYDGTELEMGFNVKYFLDALSAMKTETVEIFFNDEKSPCVIKGADDEGFLGVIMPMNF